MPNPRMVLLVLLLSLLFNQWALGGALFSPDEQTTKTSETEEKESNEKEIVVQPQVIRSLSATGTGTHAQCHLTPLSLASRQIIFLPLSVPAHDTLLCVMRC
jgi:hypothetical protein